MKASFYEDITQTYDGMPVTTKKLKATLEDVNELTFSEDLYSEITTIDLVNAKFKEETEVLNLQKFPNLKNLHLINMQDLDLFFALYSSKSLHNLKISSEPFSPLVVEMDVRTFPNLKSLEICNVTKLYFKNFIGFFDKLIDISIQADSIKGLEVLVEDLPSLRKLNLITNLSEFNLYLLHKYILKNTLEQLTLKNTSSSLPEFKVPLGLLNLKELQLERVLIKKLEKSLKDMHSLEALILNRCVTEEKITVQNLSHLYYLKFSEIRGFRNVYLNNLPSLRRAYLDADSVLNKTDIPESADITYTDKYYKRDGSDTLNCEEYVKLYGWEFLDCYRNISVTDY